MTTTSKIIRQHFRWTTLLADIDTIARFCIHCLSTAGEENKPRLYDPAMYGSAANGLFQFVSIDNASAASSKRYVLMLRDEHSNYCRLFACFETSAKHAVTAIVDWCAAFEVRSQLISDRPAHFLNETFRLVGTGLRVAHPFTLPYTLWSIGGVEQRGKNVLWSLCKESHRNKEYHCVCVSDNGA